MNSGSYRYTYVQSNTKCKWKTRIFFTNLKNAEQILQHICSIIGEQFDKHSLTETKGSHSDLFREACLVYVSKINLLINGEPAPVDIFPSVINNLSE